MAKLAIEGGKPTRSKYLPYGRQCLDDADIRAVTEVMKTDWITQGPKVAEFEKRVADYCGAKYGVAVANGTAALQAACAVAGVSREDEVITTPITFAATANVVVHLGGKPVFADIKEDTLNIDPGEIRKKLTSRTKVILPVDFTGYPAALAEIQDLARERNLTVIEDACHALGAEYRGKPIGSLSDMTVFSFHPVKHITTGEGGMVLTDNENFYENLKTMRHHGITKNHPDQGPWYYEITQPGYNYRITDFQCALGLSQMNKLGHFIQRRREIAARYNEAFCQMKEIVIPPQGNGAKPVYHIYVIQLRTETLSVDRKEIFEALRFENIGVNVHYIPVHLHPFYQRQFGYRKGDYPVSERYYDRAITLPVFPGMTGKDTDDVIKAVKKVVGRYRR